MDEPSCNSFPQMVCCLFCDPNGDRTECDVPQERVSELLGGPITFVGAFPSLDAFAVGLRDPPCTEAVNPLSNLCFEEIVRGPIVVIASDESGSERDLDVRAFEEFVVASSHPSS